MNSQISNYGKQAVIEIFFKFLNFSFASSAVGCESDGYPANIRPTIVGLSEPCCSLGCAVLRHSGNFSPQIYFQADELLWR